MDVRIQQQRLNLNWASLSSIVAIAATILVVMPQASIEGNPRMRAAIGQAPKGAVAPISIAVDATEAPRKILHARLSIPASPGPLTLMYPKWIPGEHGPTGPITDLAGLKISVAGKTVPWRRDDVEMYAFHIDVPTATTSIDVSLDFLLPATAAGFSSAASATARLAVINWNQVLLYPQGWGSDQLTYIASLRLPEGWKYGTALPVAEARAGKINFKPVSLTTLVDSPVIAGSRFRSIKLTEGTGPSFEIDMVSDNAEALMMSPDDIAHYKRLISEAEALFGAHHYQHYHFLYALSDYTAHFGLEHHESSDDRVAERTLLDPSLRKYNAGLLPHEFVHSWNGKYRRPAGLATSSYEQPMKGELLWVYEGLTEYLGDILTPRCGLWSAEEYRDNLARIAAYLDRYAGRTWRPLIDTTVAAQLLYNASSAWASWRRGVDFYDEGELLWLEADVIIRQKTNGARSLDDFCKRFHGGQDTPPILKAYTFDDVVNALNDVAPYDWIGFLTTRLNSTDARAPTGGITSAGWKLVFTDVQSEFLKAYEQAKKTADFSFSIGLLLGEDGSVVDVVANSKAAEAEIGPGMKLTAVNGSRFSLQILREAVRAARSSTAPIEVLVENGEMVKTYKLDYHDGERFPHLERDPSKPDLLEKIIHPLTQ
jgi:predicted metalloprotease with PDZ domain